MSLSVYSNWCRPTLVLMKLMHMDVDFSSNVNYHSPNWTKLYWRLQNLSSAARELKLIRTVLRRATRIRRFSEGRRSSKVASAGSECLDSSKYKLSHFIVSHFLVKSDLWNLILETDTSCREHIHIITNVIKNLWQILAFLLVTGYMYPSCSLRNK